MADRVELRRMVYMSHLKNFKDKIPNVDHTYGFLEQALKVFSILCKRIASSSKWFTEGIWKNFRSRGESEGVLRKKAQLSARQIQGRVRERGDSPKNAGTWKATMRRSISDVWQLKNTDVNSRWYQASKSYTPYLLLIFPSHNQRIRTKSREMSEEKKD